MKVLVACEFSGKVRRAFSSKGHDAWSCDLLPSNDNSPNHIMRDVIPLLSQSWDLIIAHPPCTDLASSGARWWAQKGPQALEKALAFVMAVWGANSPKIAIENPIGRLATAWRKPDQIIHPWQHGHGETKSTCLWIRGLPLIVPSHVVEGRKPVCHMTPGGKRQWKRRSTTYDGIAQAFADQWG